LRVHKFLAKKSITKMDHRLIQLTYPPAIFWSFEN
jgi:hypothetical protein